MMLIKSEGMLNRRFNRYLLLAVAILVISVPTVIAVMLGVRMHEMRGRSSSCGSRIGN